MFCQDGQSIPKMVSHWYITIMLLLTCTATTDFSAIYIVDMRMDNNQKKKKKKKNNHKINIVSFPDPTLKEGKGSGTLQAIPCFC